MSLAGHWGPLCARGPKERKRHQHFSMEVEEKEIKGKRGQGTGRVGAGFAICGISRFRNDY